MSNVQFKKVDTAYINGKLRNVYEVYETVQDCEREGVTVVTSESKVYRATITAKNKKDAEEQYSMM